MRLSFKPAAALAFVLAVAACGGGAEEAGEPAATATPDVAETGTVTPAPGATPTAEATPGDAASPAATATPTPTPTATATTAAAAPAAPAGPPQAFAQCAACHKVAPGEHGLGPSLAGIWGQKAGEVPGFEFSEAMKNSGLVWNQANLDRYLENPRGLVPGTTMAFGGVRDAARRAEIVAYLRGL